MKIGICDDSPELCAMLKNMLISGRYVWEDFTIAEFHNAEELLNSEKTPALDLLFLDIEMPGMTGMELLRRHWQVFRKTKIAFLTSHPEYLPDGYEVGVFRYLQKPVQKKKLAELFYSLKRSQVLNRTIHIQCEGVGVSIRLKDIVYAESYNNYLNIITPKKTWRSYMRLKDLLPLLPEAYFYQTHKSYIVNMNYIRDYDKKSGIIFLSNGLTIDTAYRKRKTFDAVYVNFLLHS